MHMSNRLLSSLMEKALEWLAIWMVSFKNAKCKISDLDGAAQTGHMEYEWAVSRSITKIEVKRLEVLLSLPPMTCSLSFLMKPTVVVRMSLLICLQVFPPGVQLWDSGTKKRSSDTGPCIVVPPYRTRQSLYGSNRLSALPIGNSPFSVLIMDHSIVCRLKQCRSLL